MILFQLTEDLTCMTDTGPTLRTARERWDAPDDVIFGDPDGTLLLNFNRSEGSQDLQLAPRDSRGEPLIPGAKNSEQDPLEREHTKTEGRNSCRSGGCSNTLGMG
ncbi:uncharacterized protein [Ciconia boyciana]|uniref:uncharacterized protein isoform X2 n=1 Tax=Ciconia boyciana TaxID=52775 RepID=UPI003BA234FD